MPETALSKNKQLRIHGLDLIRTLSFIAISQHHFSVKIWNLPAFSPFVNKIFAWRILEAYSRLISFSGHTVLLMSTALIAMTSRSHEKALKMIPILLGLWLVSSAVDYSDDSLFFAWDIFPLIAVGLTLAVVFYKYARGPGLLFPFVGFVFLCIPFWKIETLNSLPLFFRQMIVGDCSLDLSDWPILPWVGLVFLGYGLGEWIKSLGEKTLSFFKNEKLFWFLLLAWTPFFWGPYYSMVVGNRYSCEAMRQEPIVFFAHILPVMFLMRMSLLNQIRRRLEKSDLMAKISNLEINQNFGIAYFFHFFLIDLYAHIKTDLLLQNPFLAMAAAISLLPLTEISLRFFKWAWTKYKKSVVIANK